MNFFVYRPYFSVIVFFNIHKAKNQIINDSYIVVQDSIVSALQPFDAIFSMLGILVADIQVTLYVYQFHFFLFFISVSRVFIIIHEIGNKIIVISYLKDIVHCHSIQLILFSAS